MESELDPESSLNLDVVESETELLIDRNLNIVFRNDENEFRNTMRSLQRLARDAGVDTHPERLDPEFGSGYDYRISKDLGFVVDEGDEDDWAGMRVSRFSIGVSLRSAKNLDSDSIHCRDEGKGKREKEDWWNLRRGQMI